jgi:hypothetical protein
MKTKVPWLVFGNAKARWQNSKAAVLALKKSILAEEDKLTRFKTPAVKAKDELELALVKQKKTNVTRKTLAGKQHAKKELLEELGIDLEAKRGELDRARTKATQRERKIKEREKELRDCEGKHLVSQIRHTLVAHTRLTLFLLTKRLAGRVRRVGAFAVSRNRRESSGRRRAAGFGFASYSRDAHHESSHTRALRTSCGSKSGFEKRSAPRREATAHRTARGANKAFGFRRRRKNKFRRRQFLLGVRCF